MNPRIALIALGCVSCLSPVVVRADSRHLYSYDPSDAATRQAAGPVTLLFRKGLFHNTVLSLMSTEASATTYVRPADRKALGPDGPHDLLTLSNQPLDLYAIDPNAEGSALVAALCPGADRGWMAVGPIRINRDLTLLVIGASKAQGGARVCRTLRFAFHGEWILPPGRPYDPRDLLHSRTPGT